MQILTLWHETKIALDTPSVYIVAVSGGVDSMVLLDVLAKQTQQKLVVAHVHHGIRAESDEEYAFVRAAAARYGAQFEGIHLQLGEHASEATAREKRYAFLRSVAQKWQGTLVVAHHQDDVIETIALQLQRGTGWRGIAAMGASDIWRPLIWYPKATLLRYANEIGLEWREDVTNHEPTYARNRLRPHVASLSQEKKDELLVLWHQQCLLREAIDEEASVMRTRQRYFYQTAPLAAAQEVLRSTLLALDVACTRPQLQAILLAIKVARPHARYSLDDQRFLSFSKTEFTLIKTKK